MACFWPIHTTRKWTRILDPKMAQKSRVGPVEKSSSLTEIGHPKISLSCISAHRLGLWFFPQTTALGLIWYEGPPARPWGGMGPLWGAPLGPYRPFKGPIRTKGGTPPDPPQSRIGCTAYHIMASAMSFGYTKTITI